MKLAIVAASPALEDTMREALLGEGHVVAWVVRDGAGAVQACAADLPDVLLMEPVGDGIEATRRIMASSPCAILMVTPSAGSHAATVFAALGAGAQDSVSAERAPLLHKLETIGRLLRFQTPVRRSLVVLGASAGGPRALTAILSDLPADFGAGVVIVQHLDTEFAPRLAEWLDQNTPLSVEIARPGSIIAPGTVWLAGTDNHLVLRSGDTLDYRSEPRDLPYHPSIDVFFDSVATGWKGFLAAAVLTGMGKDGAAGLVKLRARGHYTVAQDEKTSSVYGMPKAARDLGGAQQVLPLESIGPRLRQQVKEWQGAAR